MKDLMAELLKEHPRLRKVILSEVSKVMPEGIVKTLLVAIYGQSSGEVDKASAYKALTNAVLLSADSVYPRLSFMKREGLREEQEIAKKAGQVLYHQLEDAVLRTHTVTALDKAIEDMVQAAKGYYKAYTGEKRVKMHAEKTEEVIAALEKVKASDLPSIVKFKEIQRIIGMEIEHKKLKAEQVKKYKDYLDKNQSTDWITFLQSEEFIESGNSFSKAMLAIKSFADRVANDFHLDEENNKLLRSEYKTGLNILFENFKLYDSIYRDNVYGHPDLEADVIKSVWPLLANAENDFDHEVFYSAVRNYLVLESRFNKQISQALSQMLMREDNIANDVASHVIATQEAEHIEKQFVALKGLIITSKMTDARVDAQEESLKSYCPTAVLRFIAKACADSDMKTVADELRALIKDPINVFEALENTKQILQKVPKKGLINEYEKETEDYDYQLLGDLKKQYLLEISIQGMDKNTKAEYVSKALENVIASYETQILAHMTESSYEPELQMRGRAMSVRRDRGRSIFASPSPITQSDIQRRTPFPSSGNQSS